MKRRNTVHVAAARVRQKLLEQGAANLREFGYPEADASNILSDFVFRSFFARMLEENRGKSGKAVDAVIDDLLREINSERTL